MPKSKKKIVSISLDPDVIEDLDAMAKAASLSRSALISLLLRSATGHAENIGELVTALTGAAFKGIDAEDEKQEFQKVLKRELA